MQSYKGQTRENCILNLQEQNVATCNVTRKSSVCKVINKTLKSMDPNTSSCAAKTLLAYSTAVLYSLTSFLDNKGLHVARIKDNQSLGTLAEFNQENGYARTVHPNV